MEQHDASAQGGAQDRQPPLAALLARLFGDAETLLLQELALFRAELGENAARMVGAALVALGGLLAIVIGVLGLVAAATVLLSRVLPLWLACGSVGLVFGLAGALLVLHGRRLMQRAAVVPQRTLQSLREAGDWIREELT